MGTRGELTAPSAHRPPSQIPAAELLKQAQQFFHLVGSSQTECDTIPGRQCMASCFFLVKQFEDVLIYLQSIKSYMENDDEFHWNLGVAKASSGEFREALESFERVQVGRGKEGSRGPWLMRRYRISGAPFSFSRPLACRARSTGPTQCTRAGWRAAT